MSITISLFAFIVFIIISIGGVWGLLLVKNYDINTDYCVETSEQWGMFIWTGTIIIVLILVIGKYLL